MDRKDLIQNALKFLQSENVKSAPKDKKITFLKSKGLTDEEIDSAFRQVESGTASTSLSQPSREDIQSTPALTPSLSAEPQKELPNLVNDSSEGPPLPKRPQNYIEQSAIPRPPSLVYRTITNAIIGGGSLIAIFSFIKASLNLMLEIPQTILCFVYETI